MILRYLLILVCSSIALFVFVKVLEHLESKISEPLGWKIDLLLVSTIFFICVFSSICLHALVSVIPLIINSIVSSLI